MKMGSDACMIVSQSQCAWSSHEILNLVFHLMHNVNKTESDKIAVLLYLDFFTMQRLSGSAQNLV